MQYICWQLLQSVPDCFNVKYKFMHFKLSTECFNRLAQCRLHQSLSKVILARTFGNLFMT